MLWAFNKSHISPNPLFPIWGPIWLTTALCRKYSLLVKAWHTFAIMYILFYYCILFPGVTPITLFPPVRPSVGILTYLLTTWCRVVLEKLTGLQLVKKFPAYHGTRRFITALTSVRHLSLPWASPIQSIYPLPTSWRSILILSTHLHLGLPSGLFPSSFPTKTLYTPLSLPIRATCPAHLIRL